MHLPLTAAAVVVARARAVGAGLQSDSLTPLDLVADWLIGHPHLWDV